ncbi:hypothetical protein Bca4012_036334 [Brassica carinata]
MLRMIGMIWNCFTDQMIPSHDNSFFSDATTISSFLQERDRYLFSVYLAYRNPRVSTLFSGSGIADENPLVWSSIRNLCSILQNQIFLPNSQEAWNFGSVL